MNINGKWESTTNNYKDDIDKVMLEFEAFQVSIFVRYNKRDFVVSGNTTYSLQESDKKTKIYFDFMPAGNDEFEVVQKERNKMILKDKEKEYHFKKVINH